MKHLKRQKVIIIKDLASRFDEVESQMQESEKYFKNLLESLKLVPDKLANRNSFGSDITRILSSAPSDYTIDENYQLPTLSLNYIKSFVESIVSFIDPREEMVANLGTEATRPQDHSDCYNINLDLNFLDSSNFLSPQFRIRLAHPEFFLLNQSNLHGNYLSVLTAAFSQIMAHKDRIHIARSRDVDELLVTIVDTV